ncbi:MAG TPA: hypothetical protein QF873_00115, partial [Patescibacteria group bacterium]|nr:hypothetical protein [Patescibacteria group bacterium]
EADFTQKQQLQSLIFPEKPVYTYSGFETPVLSPMFATKKTHHIDESLLVTPRGLRLNQIVEELQGWMRFQKACGMTC